MVGVSGGVDSAVAALLLHRDGYQVHGLFMKNWEEDDTDEYCAAADDLADAEAVCRAIGIPLTTVNLSFEYWEHVFTQFLREYQGGRTPNPDVLCNQEIKFRAFLEFAQQMGADRIATGHYAGLRHRAGRWRLLQAADPDKDQTYFLHTLTQSQLKAAVFPLEGLCKSEVRDYARAAKLPIHDKPDSTGICFIGERSMKEFLGRYLDFRPGDIVSESGERLGRHAGLPIYTIGQRQGLGIGGRTESGGKPWYVAQKREDRNELVVVEGNDHPALFAEGLRCGPASWVGGEAPPLPFNCTARIRHRQPLQECAIYLSDSTSQGLDVQFRTPQRAVAPGQSIAFHRDGECLGGAVIESAL